MEKFEYYYDATYAENERKIVYWLEPKYKLSVYFEIWDEGLDVEGHVKWDGCMNWKAEDYVHFCMPEHSLEFHNRLCKVWELARELLGESADF